jgi:hypothetical protein
METLIFVVSTEPCLNGLLAPQEQGSDAAAANQSQDPGCRKTSQPINPYISFVATTKHVHSYLHLDLTTV